MTKKSIAEIQFYFSSPWIIQKKVEELDECIDKVAWLLHRNSHLRGCDKCLLKSYEIQVDMYDGSLQQSEIHALTPHESITRARRKLQEWGLFLPIEAIQQQRAENADIVKEWSRD